jgi:chaperonin GroES
MYPCGTNVLILPDGVNKKTASGIILTEEKKSTTGTVAGVGPGDYQDGKRMPLQVKPGDRVMFAAVDAAVSARTITMNGRKFLLIPETQVFGVIEESEEEIEGDDAKAKEIWK